MFTKNNLAALSTPKVVPNPNSAVFEASASEIVPLPISISSKPVVSSAFVKVEEALIDIGLLSMSELSVNVAVVVAMFFVVV